MATQIRPNRLEVSDRFPMLGFTVRTDGSAKRYEIAIGTSPDLFGPDGKSRRSRDNFFSTRAAGPLPIERGEAVYVVPPEVLARFVGQQRIYYGLATFTNGVPAGADVATMPGTGSPYINVGGLTGRSLQRVRLLPNRQRAASNYGKTGSEVEWAGDAMAPGTQPAAPPAAKNGSSAAPTTQPVHYDDGYGPLPVPPPPVAPKPQMPRAASLSTDIPLDPGIGGQSIGMDALQVGDIILSTTDHLTSTVIRLGSGSQVSHAMLYVDQGGQVVEAVGGGVRLVPLADAVADASVAVAFRVAGLSNDQRQQVADSIAAYFDHDYDYVGLVKQGLFQIDKRVCSILPDGARQNCENWAGRIDLGRGSDTDFFCSSLVVKAFADAGVPITSRAPSWNSPQDIAELSFKDGVLKYVGHLKAPIPSKTLLNVFGMSMADAAPADPKMNGAAPHEHKHKHKHHRDKQLANAQGVLDWASDHVADLIRAAFKVAPKTPFSFPKIRILDGDEAQTFQHALQSGALSGVMSSIQSVLDKQYSIGIGGIGGAGAGVGASVGLGVVLTSDGHFGVYGEAQVSEGMFEKLALHLKITLVKGGIEGFNGPTVSAGVELGAGLAGSIEVLGDDRGEIMGVAVGVGGGEEIGVFFSQGIGWAVQLFAEGTVPARMMSAGVMVKRPNRLASGQGIVDHVIGAAIGLPPEVVEEMRGLIEDAIKSKVKQRYSFPPIRPATPAEAPKIDSALHKGAFSRVLDTIQSLLEAEYSLGIGIMGEGGIGVVGGGAGVGVVLTTEGHFGVYGELKVSEGIFVGASLRFKISIVKGGMEKFNEASYSVGLGFFEGIGASVEVLLDASVEIIGLAVTLGVGEEVEAFFSQGAGHAVQLLAKETVPARITTQGLAAPTQPASTTSGIGVADNATRFLPCIQGLAEQGRPITFVQRYLRSLSVAEVAALANAGLPIVSCYEENGSDPPVAYFTRAQGKHDGRRAFTQAQAVGQPAGSPIYFAVDTDPESNQQGVILDYFLGVQDGCAQYIADMQAKGTEAPVYDIGVYGSALVLEWCQAQGIATWFWQARAPGWHNNRLPWPGANLRTWRLDTPNTCGSSLDHVEGWGNEGGWTVAAADQSQALSVRLPAPPPKRRYAQGQAADTLPRMIMNSPISAVTGGEGNITWDLDQFPGVKMASQSAVAPMQSAETIRLSNWPYCDHANGTRASAWFTVDWKFSGQALGQVRITPSGTQQGAQPLRVEARIEDGKNKDANTVSLTLRLTYHFSTADGPEVVAVTELTLYSDGTIDQKSNWTAQAAA